MTSFFLLNEFEEGRGLINVGLEFFQVGIEMGYEGLGGLRGEFLVGGEERVECLEEVRGD